VPGTGCPRCGTDNSRLCYSCLQLCVSACKTRNPVCLKPAVLGSDAQVLQRHPSSVSGLSCTADRCTTHPAVLHQYRSCAPPCTSTPTILPARPTASSCLSAPQVGLGCTPARSGV
jgi:hypothetical protein